MRFKFALVAFQAFLESAHLAFWGAAALPDSLLGRIGRAGAQAGSAKKAKLLSPSFYREAQPSFYREPLLIGLCTFGTPPKVLKTAYLFI